MGYEAVEIAEQPLAEAIEQGRPLPHCARLSAGGRHDP